MAAEGTALRWPPRPYDSGFGASPWRRTPLRVGAYAFCRDMWRCGLSRATWPLGHGSLPPPRIGGSLGLQPWRDRNRTLKPPQGIFFGSGGRRCAIGSSLDADLYISCVHQRIYCNYRIRVPSRASMPAPSPESSLRIDRLSRRRSLSAVGVDMCSQTPHSMTGCTFLRRGRRGEFGGHEHGMNMV